MLSYYELSELGLCPPTGYGWMKRLPEGFQLPATVLATHFKRMPLQLQVRYEQYPAKGSNVHLLRKLI
jgi:hypothetical protein